MKKKLITISDELYKALQNNAKLSELTLMEEIRQSLKIAVAIRAKNLKK